MTSYQPLRDRCNVPARVVTERSKLAMTRSDLEEGTVAYMRSPTPRVRRRIPLSAISASHGIEEVPRVPQDAHGPRQFIPYLYLFSPRAPGAIPAGHWTHTLRLLPPSKTQPAGSTALVGSTSGSGPRGLDLHIPAAGFKSGHALHLSREHLLLARDFLALALPYYASAHPAEDSADPFSCTWPTSGSWSSATVTPITHEPLQGLPGAVPPPPQLSQADPVRVLVLGPPRTVLAIGLTYLAYASGCGVAQVMRGVLEGDGDAEWCRLLGENGEMGLGEKDMKMLERVAMNEM
ncbi:hypothetical protein C8R44DRAFT_758370 [Mycena epipterygia]|nr:hypothetical protein C8R44DRAFT_758370 [Mycena epipterygia]